MQMMFDDDTCLTLDFTYAKNALFVRQTVAVAFGIPIDREFTWDISRNLIYDPNNSKIPKRIFIRGSSELSVRLPQEEQELMGILRELKMLHPDLEVLIVIL